MQTYRKYSKQTPLFYVQYVVYDEQSVGSGMRNCTGAGFMKPRALLKLHFLTSAYNAFVSQKVQL